ncbi:MAG: glycerol-3-phosphate 1-O-acyltransferase PlsY [Rhodobacteraceae bacterium]|nr:glycerol-3-phosphate 1-O-acyltransferase PlsY [Paracoccaceae bacterium]
MLPDFLRFWGANPAFENQWPWLLGIFIAAYLLGSIPFGMVVAKVMGLGNLREIGSGNIGATNVLRTGSKKAAFATLVLDAGKGAVAVLIARAYLGEDAAQVAALAAFLGHLFPIYLMFKGGKGVAVFLGIMLALNFWAGIAACMVWLATALILRMSSLSALIAAASTPIWLLVFDMPSAVWLGVILALLVWARHHANIGRLLKGEEPKIGKK